jgi:putative FmdB family regulatory protein
MPLYDFRCTDCAGEREVMVPFERADSLELVCVDCGGDMTRTMTKSFAVVAGAVERATPSQTAKARRRGHTCSDGAVKLSRKNPFARALSGSTEHREG